MANAFTLFGEIKFDSSQFQDALRGIDRLLKTTTSSIDKQEKVAASLTKNNAVTARSYEKLRDRVDETRLKLLSTASAFGRGEVSSKQMKSALDQAYNSVNKLSDKLGDGNARLTDYSRKLRESSDGVKVFTQQGILLGGAIGGMVSGASQLINQFESFMRTMYNAGAAVYRFIDRAQEFGSEIHDAGVQTGLSAEAISTLKWAAESSGKSMQTITGAVARFSRSVVAAGDDAEKSAAFVANFGLSPQAAIADLDGALDKVFKKIFEAKPGIEQTTLAMQAFGARGGAEMIPVIDQMNGSFKESIEQAKKWGITLSEDDIEAADALGDAMGLLGLQAKVIGAKIVLEFVGPLLRGMEAVSKGAAEMSLNFKTNVASMNMAINDISTLWTRFAVTDYMIGSNAIVAASNPVIFAMGGVANAFIEATIAGARYLNKVAGWDKANTRLARVSAGLEIGSAKAELNVPRAFLRSIIDGEEEVDKLTDKIKGSGKGLKGAADEAKKLKEELKLASRAWTSESMAEFARGLGWVPGSGRGAAGHMAGSLHASGRALDLGLNTNKKTIDEIIDYMLKAIKAGIRIVDERVRPPGRSGANWTAPHIHQEWNPNKPSYFNPSLNYGGALELLKMADAERLAGKGGRDVASSLEQAWEAIKKAGEAARKLAEDDLKLLIDGQKKLADLWGKTDIADPLVEAMRKVNEQFQDKAVARAMTEYSAKIQSIIYGFVMLSEIDKVMPELPNAGRPEAPPVTDDTPGLGGMSINQLNKQIKLIEEGALSLREALTPPPGLAKQWEDFFATFRDRMAYLRSTLPSMKAAIGENLTAGIAGIGDVFANAVAQWDGTAKGFFRSLAQGFRNLVQQILAELVRIMVMKAVLSIIGVFTGGGGGVNMGTSAGVSQNYGEWFGGTQGLASGGLVQGSGSSISDSIPAMLSDREYVMSAKAVRKWGVEFFEMLNSAAMPRMAFAEGGYVGGSGGMFSNRSGSSVTNNNSPVFNIHVSGGSKSEGIVRSVKQGVREAYQVMDREASRWHNKV